MVEPVGVEPTTVHVAALPIAYNPINPLVFGTPRERHSSRAPDTDIQYGCLRSMPLADDDIRFVSKYCALLYAAFDNRLPACFQFKVSEHPYTVSSIRPGRRGGSRTHSPRGNGFTVRRASPTAPPSEINDHQSLFTLVPCYLVVGLGDMFAFLSPLEPLKLYEGVVQGA